jgi:peptide chain release factor 2
VLIEWAGAGEDVNAELARALDELQQEVEGPETRKMLSGEHDNANAIVTIHPGAGGTESQDWAEMLLRMYMKWSERRGFSGKSSTISRVKRRVSKASRSCFRRATRSA